ncbi:hypothetical protein Tco_0486484 [Tanacetum coccineum]
MIGIGTVVGVGIGVCYECRMRGMGGGGSVVADKRGVAAIVVTETSTREVDSVLRLNIESIPVSGMGLSMLEMKPDDTEELCVDDDLGEARVVHLINPLDILVLYLINQSPPQKTFRRLTAGNDLQGFNANLVDIDIGGSPNLFTMRTRISNET